MSETHLIVPDELKQAFLNAKKDNVRFFKLKPHEDRFVIDIIEKQQATASIDFKKIPEVLDDGPCVFLYRDREFSLPSPWLIIVFSPENMSTEMQESFISSCLALKNTIGSTFFQKEKEFRKKDDFQWRNLQLGRNSIGRSFTISKPNTGGKTPPRKSFSSPKTERTTTEKTTTLTPLVETTHENKTENNTNTTKTEETIKESTKTNTNDTQTNTTNNEQKTGTTSPGVSNIRKTFTNDTQTNTTNTEQKNWIY